jgi:UDP-N-acetylbacillosamine N-acetyltransferase
VRELDDLVTMNNPLYIFGGESTALEICEVARIHQRESYDSVLRVVPEHHKPDGRSTISIDELTQHVAAIRDAQPIGTQSNEFGYILSMTNQVVRRACLAVAQEVGLRPVNIIHPTAIVSPTARVGVGVYIAAFAVISCEAVIEDHVTINFHATVGHHCKVGSHTRVNPGAQLGGNSQIGKRVLVGANSFVFQGKRIGDDTQIDAMTYVDRDIEAGHLCSSRSLRVLKRPFFGPPKEATDADS